MEAMSTISSWQSWYASWSHTGETSIGYSAECLQASVPQVASSMPLRDALIQISVDNKATGVQTEAELGPAELRSSLSAAVIDEHGSKPGVPSEASTLGDDIIKFGDAGNGSILKFQGTGLETNDARDMETEGHILFWVHDQ